jgi:N6-adenosine-specific RNA methylase IME4
LPDKKYGVIYADPEWRWEAWSQKGLTNSSADNHYATSVVEDIKNRDIESIAAADCVLFLWSTVPMLPQGLEVLKAWGFRYVSNFCWVKHKAGTGYWNRNQHETLLIGTRGKIPAPLEGTQFKSVVTAPAGKHSQKPEDFRHIIETYYPNLPKIELNARGRRPRGGTPGGTKLNKNRRPKHRKPRAKSLVRGRSDNPVARPTGTRIREGNGRFQTGNIGGPGRPRGSRNKLGEDFIATIYEDWIKHGVAILARVRKHDPGAYLKIVAHLIPRQLELAPVNDDPKVTEMSEAEQSVSFVDDILSLGDEFLKALAARGFTLRPITQHQSAKVGSLSQRELPALT